MSIATRLEDDHEVVIKLSSEHHDTPSPTPSSILLTIPNSNSPNRSHSSLGHIPTVKFAPLPSPDSKRRRSTLPLGVAARSRKRRPVREGRQQGRSLWNYDPAADPLLEDPLVAFGRFVKSTTKSLWRRVRERHELTNQVEPVQHDDDDVLDIGPTTGQEQLIEVTPEHRQAVVSEKGSAECQWRWRRSTGSTTSMPSSAGLH
ncbi:hypothetical protein BDR04DRAFT_1107903 [Suillus decipiens]|nr:hypothetical protein BDR04DRAFT_1107903 [Suillus decipiens]